MAYGYTTLAQARQQLANRLFDPNMNFWSSAELTALIQESLRTFNSLSNFSRADFVFTLTPGTQWYDLSSVAGSLRLFSITDQNIINAIEYSLLEPQTSYPAAWTGTAQYSYDDLLNAVARRRDEVLGVSGCTILRRVVPALPGRTYLSDLTIDICRVAYFPAWPAEPQGWGFYGLLGMYGYSGVATNVLYPVDDFSLTSFQPGASTTSGQNPSSWRMSTEPPLSFDVDVAPLLPGNYEVLTVEAGGALSTTQATTLPIPNDWTWVARFGALADLFGRDVDARDTMRQQYCEARYQQGLAAMASASSVLAARILGNSMQVEAARAGDLFRTGWQGEAPATPDTVFIAGHNLIGMAPLPDFGYGVSMTVVQNFPVPVVDSDFLQIGRDLYDVILDYAQHIASLKMGGAEFAATMPMYDRFAKQAALMNGKLQANGVFWDFMAALGRIEQEFNPRIAVENNG